MEEQISAAACVTTRQVMEDLAEWWIHVILRDTDADRFECLETILPYLSPLNTDSALAEQFRILSLWQDVLVNTNLQGDFSKLQDKLMLLGAKFGASEEYQHCLQLLNAHEKLARLHVELSASETVSLSSNDTVKRAMGAFSNVIQVIFKGEDIPRELANFIGGSKNDPLSVCEDLESLVASTAEGSVLGYINLRYRMQDVLVSWIEREFKTPLLVQLGYRMTPSTSGDGFGSSRPPRRLASAKSPVNAAASSSHPSRPSQAVEKPGNSEEESRMPMREQRVTRSLAQKSYKQDSPMSPAVARNNTSLPDSEATELVPRTSAPAASGQESTKSMLSSEEKEKKVKASESQRRKVRARRILPSVSPQSKRKSMDPASKRRRIASKENESPDVEGAATSLPRSSQRGSLERRRRSLSPAERLLAPLSPGNATTGSQRSQSSGPMSYDAALRVQLEHCRIRELEKLKLAALARRSSTATGQLSAPGRRPVTKRTPFSKNEDMSIEEGVRRYGNDWGAIKTRFGDSLKSRRILNIKDRARILVKMGKLDASLLERRSRESNMDDDAMMV